ncbi:MAG: alpha-mannan endo,2-alpha-mannanase / glycoprotein endo-alpha,2-mannosidase [Actinomycetota bacterium]|nr:alpha-mannan endo,2-alpha-mannanase / glycoprotein endo-alpha,2-mannosidase [Actinomycetota bacterium]
MKRIAAVALLCVVLIMQAMTGYAGAAEREGPGQHVAQPVLAYYYIWYDQPSWDRGKTDYPRLGRYSSDDTNVMRHHIQDAKAAGITGFVVSWKSTPTNDRRLDALVGLARTEDFELSINYESLDFNRNPLPVDRVRTDLTRFADRYANDPLFKRLDKPLVIWSGIWKYSHDEVSLVSAAVRTKLLLLASEKSVQDYERIADVVDGNAYYWSSVDPQRDTGAAAKLAEMGAAVHAHHGLWVPSFAPGFDVRQIAGTRVVDRRDGETMRRQYAAAIASSPDALGLISWNEFSENSHVEPSTTYGDRYLKVLREITGTTVPALGPLAEDSSGSSGSSGAPWGLVIAGGAAVILLGGMTALALRRRRATAGRPRAPRLQQRSTIVLLVGALAGSAVVGVFVVADSPSPTADASQPVNPSGATRPSPEFYFGSKPVRSADSVTVVAAGDIACSPDAGGLDAEEAGEQRGCQQQMTADLVGSLNPDAVLTLGDNQYPNGSLDRYLRGYDTTWGRFKAFTYPIVGNHEYDTRAAAGYFDYFGTAAGTRDSGYYSYDLAGWHLIALNSECDRISGCGPGSPQERWLKADLEAHPAACTLAYWHRPRFSSGAHGSDTNSDAFWRALYTAGADVVLVGHDHDYERFAPLNPDGVVDPARGIREFVVGTGGHSQYRFHTIAPGSEVRIDRLYGVLNLALRPGGYDWNFVPEPGAQTGESGSGTCHR